jgi:hypothetical protein
MALPDFRGREGTRPLSDRDGIQLAPQTVFAASMLPAQAVLVRTLRAAPPMILPSTQGAGLAVGAALNLARRSAERGRVEEGFRIAPALPTSPARADGVTFAGPTGAALPRMVLAAPPPGAEAAAPLPADSAPTREQRQAATRIASEIDKAVAARMPALDLERLTEQVVRQIDQRIIARRERFGKSS